MWIPSSLVRARTPLSGKILLNSLYSLIELQMFTDYIFIFLYINVCYLFFFCVLQNQFNVTTAEILYNGLEFWPMNKIENKVQHNKH